MTPKCLHQLPTLHVDMHTKICPEFQAKNYSGSESVTLLDTRARLSYNVGRDTGPSNKNNTGQPKLQRHKFNRTSLVKSSSILINKLSMKGFRKNYTRVLLMRIWELLKIPLLPPTWALPTSCSSLLQGTHIPLLRPTNKDIGQYQLPGWPGHHMNAEVKGKCKNIGLKIHGSWSNPS